jgi:hypothetical protein
MLEAGTHLEKSSDTELVTLANFPLKNEGVIFFVEYTKGEESNHVISFYVMEEKIPLGVFPLLEVKDSTYSLEPMSRKISSSGCFAVRLPGVIEKLKISVVPTGGVIIGTIKIHLFKNNYIGL